MCAAGDSVAAVAVTDKVENKPVVVLEKAKAAVVPLEAVWMLMEPWP